MESILVELRAAEGGADAKLLVLDQLGAYVKAAQRHEL
jgi:protein subunit release factor A